MVCHIVTFARFRSTREWHIGDIRVRSSSRHQFEFNLIFTLTIIMHFHWSKKNSFAVGHRDDKGKKYACQYCPMRCVDKRQLMDHMGKHTGEKRMNIWWCFQWSLDRRQRENVNSPCAFWFSAYKCDYCVSKKFSYKGDLKNHLRTHFGDKVYGCDIQDCDERFKYHKELQEHRRIHHA